MCSFHSVDAVQLMNGNQSVYEPQSLHREKKAVCLRRKKKMSRRSSFLLKEKAFAFLVQQPAPKLIQSHIHDWMQVKKKRKKDSFCWILLGFPLHTRPAGSSELDYRPIRLKQLWGSISLDCYSQNTIRLIAALFYYREDRGAQRLAVYPDHSQDGNARLFSFHLDKRVLN